MFVPGQHIASKKSKPVRVFDSKKNVPGTTFDSKGK
tara:strand:+ start:19303 stop:19410 length:108 start_codon:yes stop_codon:yes gene_type:complete